MTSLARRSMSRSLTGRKGRLRWRRLAGRLSPTLTSNEPFLGFSLLIATSALGALSASRACSLFAFVLKQDHDVHRSTSTVPSASVLVAASPKLS